MAEVDNLFEEAEAALAKARSMPGGPKRIEALKKAGAIRNKAALLQISIGDFNKIVSAEKSGQGEFNQPTDGENP